jgi:hypothetical protein
MIDRTNPSVEAGTLPVPEAPPGQPSYPAEVVAFCTRHGVGPQLEVATRLLSECFPSAQAITVRVNEDPETADEWLVVNAVVQGDADKAFEAHQECLKRWVAAVAWPASGLICLTYTFA